MNILGLTISRTKAAVGWSGAGLLAPPTPSPGWTGVIREAFTGAWQRNITVKTEDVTAHATAWACIRLITTDIAKNRIKLLDWDNDISTENTTNSAYLPVLRKPNHYQNRISFLKSWVLSKLNFGNTYILKERNDKRGMVTALYPLNPTLVQVLVSADGQVFYSLGQDHLSGLNTGGVVVPASEIIHDIHLPLYHPLVGVSPIHACGRSVMQALKIQANTDVLFENGAMVSGTLVSPHSLSNDDAERIQKLWDNNFAGARNAGKVAVLGDNMKFEPMVMNAVDAQLIDQLKLSDIWICAAYGVPGYKVGVGPPPSSANIEALDQQYYSQCLQELIECIELCLDEGLDLDNKTSIELDLDGLIRMDTATKMEIVTKGVIGGVMKPNEGRSTFNLKPVPGGDTPYLQQQNYSLAALNKRDTSDDPFSQKTPAPALPAAPDADDKDSDAVENEKALAAMTRIAGPLLRVALKKVA